MNRLLLVLVVCASTGTRAYAAEPAPSPMQTRSGAEIFDTACAACHGHDGRGNPRSVVGFSTPLPDFTDCLFSTVEAAEGWEAVVHEGGPVRALDYHMPAFGGALSDDEIRLAVSHVRTFCADLPHWPQGNLNLPRALVTEKAFIENESLLTTEIGTGPEKSVVNAVVYERRVGAKTMMEFNVPFTTRQGESGAWRYGLGDVAVAIKRVLFHSVQAGSIFSLGEEVALPTGKEATGLGTGVTTFETFAAFGQRLPGESFLQVHTGIGLPGKPALANKETFWRVAVGKTFILDRFNRMWTPIVELVAARGIATGAKAEYDVVPQMQVSLSKRRHVLVSGGVQIPVTVREGRHPMVLTYFLWDWYEGGLRDGWK